MTVELVIPWPPSVNHYYGKRKGGGYYIKEEGKVFRQLVKLIVKNSKVKSFGEKRLRIEVFAYPPDRRKRDRDNLFKALLDALTHAGVWLDDEQGDRIEIERCEVFRGGVVIVLIEERLEAIRKLSNDDYGKILASPLPLLRSNPKRASNSVIKRSLK